MALICRTCLKKIDITDSVNLTTNYEIREQLAVCIPEIAIDYVKDPVICSSCVIILKTLHGFICQALKIENCIIDYKNSNVCDVVDLNKLVTQTNSVNDNLYSTNWRVANFVQQYNKNKAIIETFTTNATTMAPNMIISQDTSNEIMQETTSTISEIRISNVRTIQNSRNEESQIVESKIKEECLNDGQTQARVATARRKSYNESLLRRPCRKRRNSLRYGDDYFTDFEDNELISTWDSSFNANHSPSSKQSDIKVDISDNNTHNEKLWKSSIFLGKKNCKVVLTKLSSSTIQNLCRGTKRGRKGKKELKITNTPTPRRLHKTRHTTNSQYV